MKRHARIAVILTNREISAIHQLVVAEAKREGWREFRVLPDRAKVLKTAVRKMLNARAMVYAESLNDAAR